jgi:hypothetical protein
MEQDVRVRRSVGYARGVLAGAGAGVVAGLAAAATGIVMHSRTPPAVPAAWSGLASGILGGLVYSGLSRVTARPAPALWVISLVLATIDSVLIATLPFPVGSATLFGAPIVGVIVPLKQVLALAGLGRFGAHHFPAAALPTATTMHYVCAAVVSLLVPPLAGRRGPER